MTCSIIGCDFFFDAGKATKRIVENTDKAVVELKTQQGDLLAPPDGDVTYWSKDHAKPVPRKTVGQLHDLLPIFSTIRGGPYPLRPANTVSGCPREPHSIPDGPQGLISIDEPAPQYRTTHPGELSIAQCHYRNTLQGFHRLSTSVNRRESAT